MHKVKKEVGKIKQAYKASIILGVVALFFIFGLHLFGHNYELSSNLFLILMLPSFVVSLYVNLLLKKSGEIKTSNVIIWVTASIIIFPISYAVMLFLLHQKINETESKINA